MKDKTSAGVLGILLGGIGAHKFYLGQTGWGIVYLLFCWTLIPGIAGLIEGISYLSMSQGQFDARYNGMALPGASLAALPAPAPAHQNIVVNVAPPSGSGATTDVATQLKALHELKLAGVLTDEEFAAQKKKLLG
jgi:TM2 domain-containing membrane protein YozV